MKQLIKERQARYRDVETVIEDWFLDAVELDVSSEVALSDLYTNYESHAKERGFVPAPLKTFSSVLSLLMALHNRTLLDKMRRSKGIYVRGVRLANQSPHPPQSPGEVAKEPVLEAVEA